MKSVFWVGLTVAFPALANAADVAVIIDGPSDLFSKNAELLKTEYTALSGSANFPDTPTFVGDFTTPTAKKLLDQALSDSRYSVVVGIGFHVGLAVAARQSLSKPVFLPFAAPVIQGLPRAGEKSGRANLSYLGGLVDLERDLRRFRDVIRREATIFVLDEVLVPDPKETVEVIKKLSGTEAPPRLVTVGATPESIAGAIPEGSEAVFLGTLPRLKNEDIPKLLNMLNERKLLTYASEGRAWVEQGAFISLVPINEDQRRMRQVALNMQEVSRGRKPEALSTIFAPRAELAINMATARAIGFYPSFELLTEAVLVNDNPSSRGDTLSLRAAVGEAIGVNFDLSAARQDIEIAEADYRASWGEYLPVVSLEADATWIDPDVASAFFNAERQFTYTPTITQLLYSPLVVNDIASQDANRQGAVASVDATQLDTVSDAASAYLDVLRARTQEQISKENLRLTRANLALAEVRVKVGTAGPEELYRWQTEIANSRSEVISAAASRNQAEIVLNRVRNQPLEASFKTVEPLEPDAGILISEDVEEFVDNPWSFKIFRNFMAEEAKRNAPELVELAYSIESVQATLDGQKQEVFLPTLSASGNVSHTPFRAGEGSDDLPGTEGIPGRVDFQWQASLLLSFDITYPRFAEIDSTEQSLVQLNYERDSLEQQIEERIRQALHQVSASRANVTLSQDAADAAEKNFKLVQLKYRQGTVDIITLIDAQDEALSARLSAANAVYDFLVDFVEVERSAGKFQFLSSDEERQAFIGRLREFANTTK